MSRGGLSPGHNISGAYYLRGILSPGHIISGAYCLPGHIVSGADYLGADCLGAHCLGAHCLGACCLGASCPNTKTLGFWKPSLMAVLFGIYLVGVDVTKIDIC